MSAPLVSVVTVVRNAAGLIEETLRSVVGQASRDHEYLVLDGASTDGTVPIVERYAGDLAYFRSEPDRGIYDAMNRGLRLARGEFVYFLNAGDRLYADTTLQQLAPLLRGGCDFFSGRVRFLSPEGAATDRHYPDPRPSLDLLWRGCTIAHQGTFVRRELLLRLGGFDTGFRSSADYDLWFRLRAARPRVVLSTEVVAWYRGGGLSSNRRTRHTRDREDARILARHGVLGPLSALLLALLRWRPPIRRRLARWFGNIQE